MNNKSITKGTSITQSSEIVPTQTFNGRTYYKYKDENYFSSHTKRLHRDVWEFYNGKIPKGYHIHHVDGDTFNNDISNLNLIKASLHHRLEGKKRVKNNPDHFKRFQQAGQEKAKEWHKSEEGRKWHSMHASEQYRKRKPTTLKCQHCKKEYQTKFPTRSKYCSDICRSRERTKRLREENK